MIGLSVLNDETKGTSELLNMNISYNTYAYANPLLTLLIVQRRNLKLYR